MQRNDSSHTESGMTFLPAAARVALLLCAICFCTAAAAAAGQSALPLPRTVTLAVNSATPPYVLEESGSGLEVDIVRAALKTQGVDVRLLYASQLRMGQLLHEGRVDAITPVSRMAGMQNVFLSANHISYRNIAVSLRANNCTISAVADLKKYVVQAFQNASRFLGSEYLNAVRQSPRYMETPDQAGQVLAFFTRQDRVIVLDERIFRHFVHKIPAEMTDDYVIHTIFPETRNHVAFADAALRNAFNKGLQQIVSDGTYKKITSRYPTLCKTRDCYKRKPEKRPYPRSPDM
jgi:polar amino acid transport system substrate-binding protein